MKRTLIFVLALTVACCFQSFAQDTKVPTLSQIAVEHGFLERLSGRWNTTLRMWLSEKDTTALDLTGRGQTYMVLDGRYLIQRDSTRIQSKIYEDMAVLGFDDQKHQFVGVWVDKHNPGMLTLTGALNDSANVLKLRGERETAKGGKISVELIYRSFDGNNRMLQVWETPSSGTRRETLEIGYRRGF